MSLLPTEDLHLVAASKNKHCPLVKPGLCRAPTQTMLFYCTSLEKCIQVQRVEVLQISADADDLSERHWNTRTLLKLGILCIILGTTEKKTLEVLSGSGDKSHCFGFD